MDHLHRTVTTLAGQSIVVTLTAQANVIVLDELNYQAYRRGGKYRYFGGHAERSPVTITPPHSGRWHVVIDLGGRSGRVGASVSVIG